jgi:iron complex outermembrane receptor protein
MARAYYDMFRDREYLHRDPTDWEADRWFSDDPHTISEGNDDTFGGEIRGTFKLHKTDTLTVGVEIQTHEVSQPTYELDPQSGDPIPESKFGGLLEADGSIKPTTYWNLGVYAQNNWQPLPDLAVVTGLRFDYNSLFFEQEETEGFVKGLSPRAAIVYSPIKDTTVKLMYGEAFRNPSVFEAFYDDGASVCGNSEVGPERLRTVELSGIWEFIKGWSAGLSVFYTRMDGLLQKQQMDPCYEGSGPRLQFQNLGELTVLGGEAELNMRLKSGIGLYANLGLWLAEQTGEGQDGQPPNSPPVIAGAGAFVPLWKDKLLLSARVRYVSERLNWTLDEDRPEDGYVRVDATLTLRRVLSGIFASVTLTNALDMSYRDPVTSTETIPSAVPQDGIAVFARVGHEW